MARGRKKKASADEDKHTAPPVEALTNPQLVQAEAEHRRLLSIPDRGYEHLRDVELAAQLMWSIRADLCFVQGQHDAARKASMTASDHGKLAAKLARDSLVDRVAALEQEINQRRTFGSDLRALALEEQQA